MDTGLDLFRDHIDPRSVPGPTVRVLEVHARDKGDFAGPVAVERTVGTVTTQCDPKDKGILYKVSKYSISTRVMSF